jgi:sugar-specific transcriptional regulator TrmB
MAISKEIKALGLSDKETKIYLAGLELGETSAQRISKKSGIKRTTTYHTIEDLKGKGLFSTVISKGKRLYAAEDPRKLLDKVDEQKKNLEKIMPELLSIANFIDKKPRIKYYEGEQGIKEVYEDTLSYPNSEILAWVNSEAITNFKIDYLKNYYLPQRLKNKIWVKAIAPATEEMKNYKSRDSQSLRRTRLIKNKDISFNVEINIYGSDKIFIVDFKEKIGLVISNKQIFETFKTIFETNWNLLGE